MRVGYVLCTPSRIKEKRYVLCTPTNLEGCKLCTLSNLEGIEGCKLCLLLLFLERNMDSERNDNEMIVTQVSVGGFDNEVTAKMLLDYLEAKTDLIWRCNTLSMGVGVHKYTPF